MPHPGYTLTGEALLTVQRVVREHEQPRHGRPAERRQRHEKTAGGGGSGGGGTPVYLTAKVDDNTYTGNVYADGRHNTATETDATIKVGAIAAGETLPTSSAYAWFVAHEETWDVAGTDTKQWTIQPEIVR